jgi:glyoxylase-like metal-dependent hydrolase (beta-lactamase superfamily II)
LSKRLDVGQNARREKLAVIRKPRNNSDSSVTVTLNGLSIQMLQREEHMSLTRRELIAGTAAVAAMPAFGVPEAQAAAPLAGKQNPGWYRYKVGSFEVTVVTDGAAINPLADNYIGNASKADINATLAANHLPPDKVTHAYTPIVVNTGSKLVVIDTGLGPTVYQQSKGALGQFHTNLATADIDRNAVDVVIISHFHADHINGLLGADNKLAFPNAELMVPEGEWAFWMDDSNAAKFPDPIKGQFANVKRVFGALGNKATQYVAGKELVPGITSMATPGHTPGHCSHVVASGSEQILIQADVTAGATALFLNHPEWKLIFDTDGPLAEQTRHKVYDMAIADKLLIQGYHFAFPARGYVDKSGSGYRLDPTAWNPTI